MFLEVGQARTHSVRFDSQPFLGEQGNEFQAREWTGSLGEQGSDKRRDPCTMRDRRTPGVAVRSGAGKRLAGQARQGEGQAVFLVVQAPKLLCGRRNLAPDLSQPRSQGLHAIHLDQTTRHLSSTVQQELDLT
jgi:hypothetical protein